MSGRRLDYLNLAAGLVFAATGLGLAPLLWPLFAHLPGNPQALVEGVERTSELIGPLHRVLGGLVFVLAFFDIARFQTLRACRLQWRLVAMGAVFGLALSDPIWMDPHMREALDGKDVTAELKLGFFVEMGLFALVGIVQIIAHRLPAPPPLVRGERYAARWVPPIFGKTPELPQRQWHVLGLMIAASFFNTYDMQVFGLALKQIQEGLALDEGQLGFLGSAIYAGVIPGVLLALAADTWGRRRVLLITITGYTLFTGLTAFSPNDWSFLVCQFFARAFGAAEMVLAMVVVAEEIDKEHRGWALGVFGALALMGGGLALMLFAFIDRLPMGWRAMYLVGFVPLLIIAYMRRRLPETEQFERYDATRERPKLTDSLRPLVSLVRVYPARFASIGSVRFLNAFATQAGGLFLPKFLQDEHSWNPERFAMAGVVLGFLSLCAMPLLGRLGDRLGRKPVSIVLMAVLPLSVVALYNTAGLLLIPLFWFAMNISDGGADLNVSTFSKELFPTSYRSTASSARQLVGQLGGSLGLVLESVLYGVVGSHALAISIIALPALLMPVIVAFGIPETSGRPLEEISPERPPAAAG
jgi:putative MFS transporter